MPETLIDALVEAAEVRGLGVTFWDKPGKSEHLSYATILEDALRVAYGLREKGLVPGERVAIILPTGPDFYRSFYGVLLAGGVPTSGGVHTGTIQSIFAHGSTENLELTIILSILLRNFCRRNRIFRIGKNRHSR